MVDHSGTISVGGTAQKAADALVGRVGLIIHNPHATEDLYYNFGTTVNTMTDGTNASFRVPAGMTHPLAGILCPGEQINVNAATGGHPYTIKEF